MMEAQPRNQPPDDDALRKMWRQTLGSDVDLNSASSDQSYRPLLDAALSEETVDGAPPFERLDKIGKGGMADVYRARQRGLGREVALKQLNVRHAGRARSRAHFRTEAVVTGRLQHPNIVPVYALGKDPEGASFLAMKLVGGQSWASLMRGERRGDLDFHLDVLMQLCNAVGFAHDNGIVHNDLKPSNVMLGKFGEVLLLDWGLALAFSDALKDDPSLRHRDRLGGPCGTPLYMSPEQAMGQGALIGPHTDVYLLGAILYQILTGKPPNRAKNMLQTLRLAVGGVELAFGSEVPYELEKTCRQALSLAPEQRQAGALVFQAELRAYLLHRESLEITELAEQALEGCKSSASSNEYNARSDNTRLYRSFAEVVANFRAARRLWSDNQRAVEGERRARVAYARAALQLGDLGLARTQAASLPGEAGSAMRAKIELAHQQVQAARRARERWRRGLVLACLIIIAGLTMGLWLLENKNLAIRREQQLTARQSEERELLRFQTDVGYQSFFINSQMQQLEHTVRVLAEAGTFFILEGDADSRELFSSADFDRGVPPHSVWSTLYGKRVSIESPVYKLAPGVELDSVEVKLRCLLRLRSQFKWMFLGSRLPAHPITSGLEVIRLLTVEGVPLRWAYIGLQEGVMFSFPGKGGYPPDYDPRARPWYRLGAHSREIRWGEPYPDLHNLGLVLPCVTSLYDEEDNFYGVAGVELTFDFLITHYMSPNRPVLETYLVDQSGAVVVRSGQQVQLPGGVEHGAVALDTIPWPALRQALASEEESGVVEAEEDGQPLLLGFHRLPSLGWYYVEKAARGSVLHLTSPEP